MDIKEKILPKYDVTILLSTNNKCNLNCDYCFNKERGTKKIEKLETEKILKTLKNSKRKFQIYFTGPGEPFLIPKIVKSFEKLTKEHYICLNTNLISTKIKDFIKKIPPQRVTYIIASMHIKEFEKKGHMKTFMKNLKLLIKKGFKIYVLEVAYPPILKDFLKYKKILNKEGIELHSGWFIGKYNGKKYPEAYTSKEIKEFGLDKKWEFSRDLVNNKNQKSKGKLCNAGYNIATINLQGDVTPCFYSKEKLGNLYRGKIKFKKNMRICNFEKCNCPMTFDRSLFNKALKETTRTQIAKLRLKYYLNKFKPRRT